MDGTPGEPYEWVFDATITYSPDSRHLAYAVKKNGRASVVLDGKAGRPFDGIGAVVFSPGGARVAYAAQRKLRWCVVADGIPGADYDWIAAAPGFSPNERRLVYVAERFTGIAGREQFVVLDGMEGKPFGWIRGDVRFIPTAIASRIWQRRSIGDSIRPRRYRMTR